MKKFLLITASLLSSFFLFAQNVGIGTIIPKNKLSVNGTITVDHDFKNSGTLDSASLLFGATSDVGITSNKNAALIGYRGLDFWTNGIKRISVREDGKVGIGITNPLYKMHINGDSYVNGDGVFTGNLLTEGNHTVNGNILGQNIRATTALRADARLSVGGVTDENYRLRVYDGDARIGGELHATGNSAIGGFPDVNYRFRVYDGSSRFGGNVYVTGDINAGSGTVETNAVVTNSLSTALVNANTINAANVSVSNSLTIDGKGSVRSNGPSSLRMGFDEKTVDIFISNNNTVLVNANITDFSGGSNDVRVMVSQISLDVTGTIWWPGVIINIIGVDAAANTCTLSLTNKSGNSGTLRGTIYLTSIAKD